MEHRSRLAGSLGVWEAVLWCGVALFWESIICVNVGL